MTQNGPGTLAERIADREVGRPTSKLIITDVEVETFLFWGAKFMQLEACKLAHCLLCEKAHRLWWEWCNSLHGANRIRLQRVMRHRGVPLPPGPSEIVG
jgi:hypothetical protein